MTIHQVHNPLSCACYFYFMAKFLADVTAYRANLCWHLTLQVCQTAGLWSTKISHLSKKAHNRLQ
jgi:hypothetical protein